MLTYETDDDALVGRPVFRDTDFLVAKRTAVIRRWVKLRRIGMTNLLPCDYLLYSAGPEHAVLVPVARDSRGRYDEHMTMLRLRDEVNAGGCVFCSMREARSGRPVLH